MSTIARESRIRPVQSYGIPGGFGGVPATGRGGPPERAVGELVDCPARVLLEPMVLPALRAAVTQARPAACLVRGVVLEVTGGLTGAATSLRDRRPARLAQPRRLGRQRRLLRGDLPAFRDDRVQVRIPRRNVLAR